jgi:hypothetical protein
MYPIGVPISSYRVPLDFAFVIDLFIVAYFTTLSVYLDQAYIASTGRVSGENETGKCKI